MGRNLAGASTIPLPLTWLLHMALAVVYGLIVSVAVARLTNWRAILVGGVVGLILYFVNFGVVSLCFPGLVRAEGLVAFTHVVFGLLAAGAYRGLLHRRILTQQNHAGQ
jgi:ascorbate-specific PTS system EIIC-type component UlaA